RAGSVARGRAEGLRQGQARSLQISAPDRVHRRVAEDGDRQDPALPPARTRGPRYVTGVSFVDVPFGARTVSIGHAWIAPSHTAAPLVVFLHEGLGSVAMWKDYPGKLCDEGGYRGLVFSRVGYGRSTPRPRDERWPPDFMEAQAREFLPRFFARLGIGADGARPWLLGHSDGASIALIHAAAHPETVAGVIAVAPHIVVEELTIRSIEAAKHAYVTTDLKSRLARYHDDPDSAFG